MTIKEKIVFTIKRTSNRKKQLCSHVILFKLRIKFIVPIILKGYDIICISSTDWDVHLGTHNKLYYVLLEQIEFCLLNCQDPFLCF